MIKLMLLIIMQMACEIFARAGFAQWRYIDYQDYIHSQAWRRKRALRLLVDNHTCQMCGATERLHVHHLSYDNLGIEPLFDLVTLCEQCHREVHRN